MFYLKRDSSEPKSLDNQSMGSICSYSGPRQVLKWRMIVILWGMNYVKTPYSLEVENAYFSKTYILSPLFMNLIHYSQLDHGYLGIKKKKKNHFIEVKTIIGLIIAKIQDLL